MDQNKLVASAIKLSTVVGTFLSAWAALTLLLATTGGSIEILGAKADFTVLIYGVFILIFGSRLAEPRKTKSSFRILAWSHLLWLPLMPEGVFTFILISLAVFYFYAGWSYKPTQVEATPRVSVAEGEKAPVQPIYSGAHWSVSLAKTLGVIFIIFALLYFVFAIFIFGLTSNFIVTLFRLPFCIMFSMFGLPCE